MSKKRNGVKYNLKTASRQSTEICGQNEATQ